MATWFCCSFFTWNSCGINRIRAETALPRNMLNDGFQHVFLSHGGVDSPHLPPQCVRITSEMPNAPSRGECFCQHFARSQLSLFQHRNNRKLFLYSHCRVGLKHDPGAPFCRVLHVVVEYKSLLCCLAPFQIPGSSKACIYHAFS